MYKYRSVLIKYIPNFTFRKRKKSLTCSWVDHVLIFSVNWQKGIFALQIQFMQCDTCMHKMLGISILRSALRCVSENVLIETCEFALVYLNMIFKVMKWTRLSLFPFDFNHFSVIAVSRIFCLNIWSVTCRNLKVILNSIKCIKFVLKLCILYICIYF